MREVEIDKTPDCDSGDSGGSTRHAPFEQVVKSAIHKPTRMGKE